MSAAGRSVKHLSMRERERERLPVGFDTTDISMVWPRQLGKVAEFRLESSRIIRCTEICCFSTNDKSWFIQWMTIDIADEDVDRVGIGLDGSFNRAEELLELEITHFWDNVHRHQVQVTTGAEGPKASSSPRNNLKEMVSPKMGSEDGLLDGTTDAPSYRLQC